MAKPLGLVLLLGSTAAAQFDQCTWMPVGGGSGTVTATTMHVTGSDVGLCFDGDFSGFVTVAAMTGHVHVECDYITLDDWPSYKLFDAPGWQVLDQSLAPYSEQGWPDGHYGIDFDVTVGQSFGLGVWSVDCIAGPGIADFIDFSFTPAWTNLGQGLAGSAGVPKLQGLGTIAPDSPLTVRLNEAAPSAPLTLVVGLSSLAAPFKGGTLVPYPDVLVGPLATDASGLLVLQATWPEGVPIDTQVFLQAWIADAGAPSGLAASNALLGVAGGASPSKVMSQ